ncbi:SYS1 domain-containing protein [Rhizoctonia solani AG-1 IA]|uniref:Integral membrane protein S linking the trans Golgi network n=2 Tax=Rhizoctonia solani TaxID=456999 RepID=A0A8H7H6T4_9AGAM
MSSSFRLPHGWHPTIIIAQIIALQCLHYLVLSLLIPPLLYLFANPYALAYEGGAANVAMVMDWRELVGRATIREPRGRGWSGFSSSGAWSGGVKLGGDSGQEEAWVDPVRSWIISLCWLVASTVDVYFLYILVRRPTHILDFALTLVLNHTILTTYYARSLPTSLFFWLIMALGAVISVVGAEQLCVKREMREGIEMAGEEQDDEVEMDRRD